MDELSADRAEDGAVGADDDPVRAEAERAEHAHGIGVAAAGGDDDLDAGLFGAVEGGAVTLADQTVGAEQGAVDVDRDKAGFGHLGWVGQAQGGVAGVVEDAGDTVEDPFCGTDEGGAWEIVGGATAAAHGWHAEQGRWESRPRSRRGCHDHKRSFVATRGITDENGSCEN